MRIRHFNNETPPTTPPAPSTPPKEEKKFTQEEVNRITAEERRKTEQRLEKKLEELSLSAAQKADLEVKLEEVRLASMTKEEQAKAKSEAEKKQYEAALAKAKQDASVFQERFTSSTIQREIADAAVQGDAFNTAQVLAILRPNARLTEELDAEGKPTGNFITKVKYQMKDKEGKSLTLDLTPAEVVDKMKEDTSQFGNLFKSKKTPGVGGQGSTGKAPGSFVNLSQAEINRLYNENPEALGLRRRT